MVIKSSTCAALLAELKNIDISVFNKADRMDKRNRERRSVLYLLSTMAASGGLEFPLELTPIENNGHKSPDYIMKMNGLTVGVEITDAFGDNDYRRDQIFDRSGDSVGPVVVESPVAKRKNYPELELQIEDSRKSDGCAGDQSERIWANYMFLIVRKKIQRLLKGENYERFDEDWLLVEDWLPISMYGVDRSISIGYLVELIGRELKSLGYHRVMIRSKDKIHLISDSVCLDMPVNDLWCSNS